MKLLVLGGTRFLGRHLAALALARGHRLTLLHRGRSDTTLFPQAEHRLADRDGDLAAALAGGTWDAVIDTSAYVPRQVRAVAAVLAGRVAHYQLVSTISVYAQGAPPPLREDTPLQPLDDPTTEAVTGATYGGLKALCEAAALQGFGAGHCQIVRPGLIVGPHDPTGRFSWWVRRLQRGGEVLAPGDPAAPVQFIDVRDLAAWMLDRAEAGGHGIANATGPVGGLTMGDWLGQARDLLNPAATLHWIDEAPLLAAGVAPWMELPLWLPAADSALHRCGIERAVSQGLQTRPLAETLLDTAAWLATLPGDAVMPAPLPGGPPRAVPGMDAAREASLIAANREQGFDKLSPNGLLRSP
jgi:2'-hydroxyisoflavone reductase